ncbi:hypothetical protein SEUCBS139899_006517 [Sporothrix eucalyptigena]|uniref:Enoyl reductase (ER) domain-containing protein n=1 Tax=Sporothrix eucalyptigena TaxID=1812306 RepID=A0ABP0B732_9PEZI
MTTIIQEHPVLFLETAEPVQTADTQEQVVSPPLTAATIDIKVFNSTDVVVEEVIEPRSIDSTISDADMSQTDSFVPSRASSATSLASTATNVSEASTAPSTVGDDTSYQEEKPTVIEETVPEPTYSALLITPERGYELVSSFPAPTAASLAPTEVMIRNKATGLNHIDWMSVAYNFCLPSLPWVTGREMAGVVEAVGSDVSGVKPGDAVWTTTYYKDRRAGCFQDLVVVPQHTVFPIPTTLDFHTAACLGVAGVTAAMTLWQWLNVPMARSTEAPSETSEKEKEVLLVWGGSTVTGQFAIQLAAQAGLEIVAVCSTATADLVRSRGATHVVTYTGKTDMHVIGEILCCSGGRLTRAIDLVGAKTAKLVLQVIAASGRTVDFAPLAFMSSKDVVPANVRVHTVEIKQFVLNEASGVYGQRLNELVASGAVLLPAVRVLEGGLAAVEQGLAMVKEGNLDGKKLVVAF